MTTFYPKLTIYTDGGARGNPGPAAIGVVICSNDERMKTNEERITCGECNRTIKKYSKYIGIATNNEAEYQAIIFALQQVKKFKPKEIDCFLDSELVVQQLNHRYKIKEENLIPLFIKAWNLMIDFEKVSFIYIPRQKNKEADKLVNEVLNAEASKAKLF